MENSREIPFDLITDILSRVPANNIIRFKSVSKQWFSLIQDPVLVDLHLHRSKEQDARQLIRVWKVDYSSNNVRYHTMICSIDKYGIASPIHPKPYIHTTFNSPSCNGLLCYVTPELNMQVSNPVIGETITLPKPNFLNINTVTNTVFAIGFDSFLKLYKIVAWDYKHYLESEAEIFTLGTNSWRKITGSCPHNPALFYYFHEAVYVDGVSYWYNVFPGVSSEIMSFDYEEEKFETVKVPNDILASLSGQKTWLCVSQGHLCIAERKFGKENTWVITLWLLKYGGWKDQPPINVLSDGFRVSSRIATIGNGEIIIRTNLNRDSCYNEQGEAVNSYLDSYNEQGESINSIQLDRLQDGKYQYFNQFHVGSLVRLT